MLWLILIFLSLIPFCSTSGHLELTIRSPWIQQAAVAIYQSSAPFGNIRSVILHANEQQTLRFPVNFTEPTKVVISVGGSPNYGLQSSRFETTVIPEKGQIMTPEMVPAPFNGFKIVFDCDSNYHGESCNQACNEEVAARYGKRCNSAGYPSCPKGFMGQQCDQQIAEVSCPCENNGKCATSFLANMTEVPLCECLNGFYGPVCQSRKEVQKVEIRSTYTPELRFVPSIIEKYYDEMKMKNELISVQKRVNIMVNKSKRRRI